MNKKAQKGKDQVQIEPLGDMKIADSRGK